MALNKRLNGRTFLPHLIIGIPMHPLGTENQPLVSVIMPTFNRAGLITKSISSVLTQTHHNLELVVVDDRSTDNTAAILNDLSAKDPRVRYFLNTGEKGAAGARNTGLAKAQGEYVAFLDDDDEFLPEKLAMHMQPFTENPHVDAVISTSRAMLATTKAGDTQWLELEFTPQKLFHPCNVMCRRRVLQDICFRCNYMEWRDFAFQLYQNGLKVVLTEQQLVRIHNTGSSLSKNAEAMLGHALMNAIEYNRHAAGRPEEPIFRHYLANCQKNYANHSLKRGTLLKAARHYLASFLTEKKLRNLIPFA